MYAYFLPNSSGWGLSDFWLEERIPWRDASVTGLSTEDASTKYRRWCSGVGRAGFEDYSGTVVTCFM